MREPESRSSMGGSEIRAPGISGRPNTSVAARSGDRLLHVTDGGVKLGERVIELPGAVAVAAWDDGTFVVLAGSEPQSLVRFDADGSKRDEVQIRNVLGESEPLLIAAPDGGVFVIASTRRVGWYLPAEKLGSDALVVGKTLRFGVPVFDAAALDASHLLLTDGRGTTATIGPDDAMKRVSLGTRGPVERIVRRPAGGLWVLERAGALHLVEALASTRRIELEGTGIGLSADASGVAVLTAEWSNADRNQRTLRLFDADGSPTGTRDTDHGNDARDMVLLQDGVQIGDESVPRKAD